MITCTLGEKKYCVDFVTGRVLREIGPALEMLGRINAISAAAVKGEKIEDALTIPEAMDAMVKWFCVLFGNQFTPDEVYDNYPSDRFMHDVSLALMAVQTNATGVLSEFPTKAAETTAPQTKKRH